MKLRSIALLVLSFLISYSSMSMGLEEKILNVDEVIVNSGIKLNSTEGLIRRYESFYDLTDKASVQVNKLEETLHKKSDLYDIANIHLDAYRYELSETIDRLLKVEEIQKLKMQPMEFFFTKQDIRSLLKEGRRQILKKSPIMDEGGSGPIIPPVQGK